MCLVCGKNEGFAGVFDFLEEMKVVLECAAVFEKVQKSTKKGITWEGKVFCVDELTAVLVCKYEFMFAFSVNVVFEEMGLMLK